MDCVQTTVHHHSGGAHSLSTLSRSKPGQTARARRCDASASPLMAEGGIPFLHGMRGACPGTWHPVWRMNVPMFSPECGRSCPAGHEALAGRQESKNLTAGTHAAAARKRASLWGSLSPFWGDSSSLLGEGSSLW